MANHIFYPPTELPDQVDAYAAGLATHKKEFGEVTGNAPADLKELVAAAHKLAPLAEQIAELEVQLAAKLDAYHKAASPLWSGFAEKLAYARVYATTNDNAALASFLKAFRHNAGRHAAKAAHTAPATGTAAPTTGTTGTGTPAAGG